LQVTIGGGKFEWTSSTDTFEFMFLQNAEERDLGLNSALKCGLSKRMPFEAGEASRIEASRVPMPAPRNCVQL
jgi:hypothetical protein